MSLLNEIFHLAIIVITNSRIKIKHQWILKLMGESRVWNRILCSLKISFFNILINYKEEKIYTE